MRPSDAASACSARQVDALTALGHDAFVAEREKLIAELDNKSVVRNPEQAGQFKHTAALEELACTIHADNASKLVNLARGKKFFALRPKPAKNLPTQNALDRHIQRADLAAEHWALAVSDPQSNGWNDRG